MVERANETFDSVLKQVSRPIGSEKVSELDEFEEYLTTIAMTPDPGAAFKRRIEERVTEGFSTEQALTWAVDWVERNEKKVTDGQL